MNRQRVLPEPYDVHIPQNWAEVVTISTSGAVMTQESSRSNDDPCAVAGL